MQNRRTFIKATGLAGASLVLPWTGATRRASAAVAMMGDLDPSSIPKYVTPLIIPPAMPRDQELSGIIARAMSHDASQRFTLDELVRALKQYLTGDLVFSHRYSMTGRMARWARRNRAAAVAIASVILFAIAGALGAGHNHGRGPVRCVPPSVVSRPIASINAVPPDVNAKPGAGARRYSTVSRVRLTVRRDATAVTAAISTI